MNEEVVTWAGGDLVGILAHPPLVDGPTARTAFVLLGAGLLHSVGPNRLYVQIARRLAARGATVLRFDAKGIGDSAPNLQQADLEHVRQAEIEGVTEMLAARVGASRFAFIGICSGATVAFRAATEDERTVGVALANMDVGGFDARLDEFLAGRQASRYYTKVALSQRASWRRLLSGRSNYAKIARSMFFTLGRSHPRAPAVEPRIAQLVSDLDDLARREVELLIVTSEVDRSIDYVDLLRRAMAGSPAAGAVDVRVVRRGDHTFTLKAHQAELLGHLEAWSERVLRKSG